MTESTRALDAVARPPHGAGGAWGAAGLARTPGAMSLTELCAVRTEIGS